MQSSQTWNAATFIGMTLGSALEIPPGILCARACRGNLTRPNESGRHRCCAPSLLRRYFHNFQVHLTYATAHTGRSGECMVGVGATESVSDVDDSADYLQAASWDFTQKTQ
jgi:hypothetical protein